MVRIGKTSTGFGIDITHCLKEGGIQNVEWRVQDLLMELLHRSIKFLLSMTLFPSGKFASSHTENLDVLTTSAWRLYMTPRQIAFAHIQFHFSVDRTFAKSKLRLLRHYHFLEINGFPKDASWANSPSETENPLLLPPSISLLYTSIEAVTEYPTRYDYISRICTFR